jgi:DNA repair protein RadD
VNTTPSKAAILSSQIEAEWVDVMEVHYRAHHKIGSPPSLRVRYRSGLQYYQEWITLEHQGYPRAKAEAWWRQRAPGTPVPATVAEALPVLAWLAKPQRIQVRPEGKYMRVLSAEFRA